MSTIYKVDTDGSKPLLSKGELGYDDYTAGSDTGRVYVGDGASNIALARKNEVDLKAPLASPALTGSPTAPTQTASDNSTKIASTAYADAAAEAAKTAAEAASLALAGGAMTGPVTLKGVTETQLTKAASFTPVFAEGTVYSCTGAMTITMPTATAGKSFTIFHDTGTDITWGGTIKWSGGAAPTAAAAIEIYVFISDGTNWYGMLTGTGYA
jgi:hypothetical protein